MFYKSLVVDFFKVKAKRIEGDYKKNAIEDNKIIVWHREHNACCRKYVEALYKT